MSRIAEVKARYPEQWVLAEVLKEDRYHRASHLRVLAFGSDRDKLAKASHLLRAQHPDAELFLFYTGELIPKDLIVVLEGVGQAS